jgi:LmbE family N-acetylglucosaminyl deacetylase
MTGNDEQRCVLVTVAHPDDESFGCGSLIATAASHGRRVVVCCASRGEAGEDATGTHLDSDSLGAARETELRAAAALLGAVEVEVLGFGDSGWDGAAPAGSIGASVDALRDAIADAIERHRPAVVVTMDPTGSDGHRDHAAVGRATTDAFARTVTWPASLYHWCLPRSLMAQWAQEVAAHDDESVYLATELGRPDCDITTIVDASAVLDRRWAAIAAHRTQTSPYAAVSPELADAFVRRDHLVRVVPQWTGGPAEPALHIPCHPSRSPR